MTDDQSEVDRQQQVQRDLGHAPAPSHGDKPTTPKPIRINVNHDPRLRTNSAARVIIDELQRQLDRLRVVEEERDGQ